MSEHGPGIGPGGEDFAWATIAAPLPPAALADFVADVARLFRLNPYLDIESFQQEPGSRFRVKWLNEMNGLRQELNVEVVAQNTGYTLRYDRGLKRTTEVMVEPHDGGAKLTLKEHYDTPAEAEREERLKEVDRSLVPWAASVHDYLAGLRRWGWFLPYRWYKSRVWLRMSPRHRRIARLIVWTTVLEFIVFVFVFAIYWLELRRV